MTIVHQTVLLMPIIGMTAQTAIAALHYAYTTTQQVSQYWYSGNASMDDKYKIHCHSRNFITDWQTVTQQRKH